MADARRQRGRKASGDAAFFVSALDALVRRGLHGQESRAQRRIVIGAQIHRDRRVVSSLTGPQDTDVDVRVLHLRPQLGLEDRAPAKSVKTLRVEDQSTGRILVVV